MRSGSRVRRGFTLIEAIVSVAVASIGIVASLEAIGSLTAGNARAKESEYMQSLALQKMDELMATGVSNTMPTNGDFQDRNDSRYTWTAQLDPTPTTNLTALTVKVVSRDNPDTRYARVYRLVYQPTATTGASGG